MVRAIFSRHGARGQDCATIGAADLPGNTPDTFAAPGHAGIGPALGNRRVATDRDILAVVINRQIVVDLQSAKRSVLKDRLVFEAVGKQNSVHFSLLGVLNRFT